MKGQEWAVSQAVMGIEVWKKAAHGRLIPVVVREDVKKHSTPRDSGTSQQQQEQKQGLPQAAALGWGDSVARQGMAEGL